MLLFTGLTKRESRQMKVTPIDSSIYYDLKDKYDDMLSCPCSNVTIPYEKFINNTITFHPVCSSMFISNEWFEALYSTNASKHGAADFRTTASHQFQLLADLCAMSNETINQYVNDLKKEEILSFSILTNEALEKEVNSNIEKLKTGETDRMNTFLNYSRINMRSNYLISALNTNLYSRTEGVGGTYEIWAKEITYHAFRGNTPGDRHPRCGETNLYEKSLFYTLINNPDGVVHLHNFIDDESEQAKEKGFNSSGFYAACTPLEAILLSTLDCLYQIECLQVLNKYFPNITKSNIDLNASLLLSKPSNLSVQKLLLNLFIDEELPPHINYSKYFDRCLPSYCTYTTADEINIAYALTLFISLYGSLIVVLRFIAPLLIQSYFKLRQIVTNRDIRQNLLLHMKETWMKFIRKIKRLNLFKDINERTEETIQQQRITTRVYLVLLLVIGIPHRKFISLSPRFHQICTSDLLDKRWISLLVKSKNTKTKSDWRNRAAAQFKLLSELCQLSQKTVNDSIDRFLFESLVSADLIHEREFSIQINLTLQQFFTSTVYPIEILNQLTHLLMQVDQPFMGLVVDFGLSGTHDINTKLINCVCMADPNCNSPAAMYDEKLHYNLSSDRNHILLASGLIEGCFVFDSLLLSSLECFYSNSFCYRLLMSTAIDAVLGRDDYYPWYAIRPLVYDSTSCYPPTSSIKTILQNSMIEQWNPNNSYEDYYRWCLPTYCIYSQVTNQKTFLKIILSLITLIGGLTLVLRIIVPHLVKFIRRCFRKNRQQQIEEDEQQQVHVSICKRLRTFLRKIVSLVYAKVVELNSFRQRDFGSSFNPEIYQQLGRWATRLFIVCLICSFLLLLVYRIIEPATLIKTFSKPDFQRYQGLKEKYKDQLTCICQSFATQYDRFLEIQYNFHQICESEFTTNEWRTEITSSIVANLSKYDKRDYRRYLTSHLQYLRGLCQLSIKTVVDDKEQLLSRSLITNELLSENEFTKHFNEFEEQHRLNLPKLFDRLLMLILSMNHGNAFMSTHGTNYQYIAPWFDIKDPSYVITEALLYDHECSCALSRYCSSDAYLFNNKSRKTIFIEGMKIGCTPSESFHQSTLQCFYNSSCLHLLVENSIVPLVPRESRYLINTTIDELRKNLFLENWNTTSNYSAYFHQCSPSICSYSLSIIFQWICPKLVLMIFYIYLYLKKKRNNSIHPISSEITAENENEDVSESIPSITTHQ
ncbi:unnamed protein product [Adineta steineri]|uniref:Uncharacterized protein n=1 Tax=Adineta steineri TaxID=433720 RepID=A0A815NDF1_9BILA|nr:unnamed protein product [Adineta steineri]CAF3876174.1 unnamed protein product [Adineta steineri]